MKNTNQGFDRIISEIINRINLGNTVIFCGAGISKRSGLPIVNQFIPYLLNKLDVTKENAKLILDKENNPRIPFEVIIAALKEHSKIDNILNIYEQGIPNTNHVLLAKLVKSGKIKTIVTTNFDKLIEKALIQEGLEEGKHFDLIFRENEFDNIDWTKDRIRIVKIHGSIDDKKAMAITINQIASRLLLSSRKKIIDYIFSDGKHKHVLILGYSSSDTFDIVPQIEAINHNHKKVYYIEHSDTLYVKDISNKIDKNPFKKFEGSLRLFYDTDKLIEIIWKSTFKSKYELKTSDTNWKENIDTWYYESVKSYTDTIKYIIPGRIYSYISENNSAEKYFKKALVITRQNRDKKGEGNWRGNLGNIYHAKGNYFRAILFYFSALRIARQQKDKVGEGSWLGGIGNVYYSRNKYQKSIRYYKHALEIAIQITDNKNKGNWLGSVGNAYYSLGDYICAIAYYEKALEITRQIGDKKSEGSWIGNIGNVYKAIGESEKAKRLYLHALEIAEKVIDKINKELWIKNLNSLE